VSKPNAIRKLTEAEREKAVAEEQAKHIRFSERKPVPTMAGRPQMYEQHVIAGANPNDYTIPYDSASLKDSVWRGFVLCEDRHGSRYVPIQMTYEQLQEVQRDEIVAWDTRSSQAERIEREFTSDAFTLRRGCWDNRTDRERFADWVKRRGDGDKPPGHYMSGIIRKLPPDQVRAAFTEAATVGFLGAYKPSDVERWCAALFASLTVV